MKTLTIKDVEHEINVLFSELDDLDYQNRIVVHEKLMDWKTFHICNRSEKLGILKLYKRLKEL